VGLAGMIELAKFSQLPIHAHRNGWGYLSRHPMLGWSFTAWSKIWRLAGADHMHVNGLSNKFSEPDDSVIESARSCLDPMFDSKPCAVMPVFSSGQSVTQVPGTYAAINTADLIVTAGGGILAHPHGPGAGVSALREAWDAALQGVPQADYVGIDNHAAGRTAGYLLGRLCHREGRVLILSSRLDYLGHIERSGGCREVLAAQFPHLRCDVDVAETHDDPDRCYLALKKALQGRGDVVGLYNTGAGSPGIHAALQRFAQNKVCWVTHEISDDHRQYLQQGVLDVVIDQDPDTQAIRALQHTLAALGMAPQAPTPDSSGEFRLYFAENMGRRPYLA
jgi:hypothetical protein